MAEQRLEGDDIPVSVGWSTDHAAQVVLSVQSTAEEMMAAAVVLAHAWKNLRRTQRKRD